jgi:ribosomal protein L5
VKKNAGKVSKKAIEKSTISSKLLSKLIQDVDPKAVEARKSVNAQVLLRGVAKEIKKLGPKPISRVAKHAVKKGIALKPVSAGVSKKQANRKDVAKSLNLEIQRAVGLKPSEVKARRAVAQAKISVNTEVFDCNLDCQECRCSTIGPKEITQLSCKTRR